MQCSKQLLCKNARIERSINSENLGTTIAENGSWNQKIWTLEAFRGKTIFLGGVGAILEFLKWLEGLGAKERGSYEFWGFFRDLSEFLEGLKWF
jgi:hypothetical protein